METKLSIIECDELALYETTIQNGLQAFYEVGNALLTIRDKRLYRANYQTFDEYCQTRWQMHRSYAYRLMDASNVVNNLSPIGDIPATESQARPLVALDPLEQQIVWEVARQTAPNGKVTAAHIKSVVNVFKEVVITGAIDDGTGNQIRVSEIVKAAVTEETYERKQRQIGYLTAAAPPKLLDSTGYIVTSEDSSITLKLTGDTTILASGLKVKIKLYEDKSS